ncbi:MAG TPA: phage tail spike protein, partial [Nitrosarchaeum sp.]|nr:phage tail spike protein [Nitrosarchaeum sp.]
YLNDKPIPVDQIKKESRYEGARPNFDYTFKVVVFDNDGDFIESGTITQRIDVPQIPTGLNANPKDREIILTWDLNKENFVHHYDIYQNEKVVATVLQGTNTIKIQNLINNAMYSYQIVAVSNNNISSLKSEYVIATPLLDIPNKPKITHHKIIGNGGAEIHWEHLVKEGHSHYNLYRNGFLYAEKIKDKFYQTDFLEKNITHSFQVEAFDYNNDGSGFSNNEYVTIYSEFIEPLSVDVGQISENVKTVQPKLFLCKPNKTTIAILKEASGITFNTRLADLNELIFRIPYFTEINHELVINPYYKELKVRYLIRLEFGKHLEYFIINEINNDSESNSAEIHCFSLGYELKDKSVPNLEEQIFTCHSAFEKALDGQFNWIIGANIKNPDFYWNRESRTFDIQSQTVLDLIIQIATSYNAILVWDTVNRVIDLQNPTIPSENKGLKIKYGKYLKTLSKTSSIDEMVTRLIPVGEDNLSIASVTPNGSNALEDFSFFMEGFSRDLDNFARFYLNSKAVVTNPNDPFYAEQGFTNVPMGAIFKNIDKDTLTLSTRIDTNSVSYGVINAVNLYRKTNDINWLNKARNIAQFLIDRQQTGDFYTARFSFVPNVVDFNSATGLFESQIGEIDLRVQYLTAIALMEINNIDPNNAYTTLLEGILKLCSMAQNNVVKRATTDNEIEEYMVGAIYRALNQSGNATDGVPTYTFTWNQFSISTIDVLAMCWKNYITYFGNATKTDSENTSYIPQDLINNSSIFIYEIYNQGKLTMSTTALPYGFMHYDYADPLNAEGEYVPLAKNMDWIDGIWGDTWFATDLMLWEINGIALLSKYSTIHFDEEEEKKSLLEIANEYRSILFEKRDIENYPNDIMFFDRYSFDGTGGVGEDTSKAITNTALFLSLEKNLDLNIYEKQLKETLIKYQIKDNNELIDGSYQWATDSGLIEMKTVGEIFRALNETNYSTTLTSSTYMSDELCNAILDYQELIEELSPDMQEYLNQKKVLKEELLELELELTSKETELFLVQDNLDRRKAEGSLFYHNIPYGGTPYTISHEIHKDYKYILMAKTNIVGNITVTTNNKTFTFANTDWLLVEKIAFDRTGETQEQRTIHTYNYNIGYTGTTNCILEFQLVRILPQEFDEIGNEIELLNKYNEFNAQLTYDNQLALVNAKKNEIAMIDTNIETLNDKLSLFNNFSQELLLERDLFVIEKEYVDEKISNAEELKNRALDKFQELKYPVVTIEIDIVNFLEVLEEHYNWNKLELGTIV